MAKNKKMKDKVRQKLKEEKRRQKIEEKNRPITFKCLDCYAEEDIPKDVVDTFDIFDDGDKLVPPRFDCEFCGGTMEPIEYTSEQGITYRLDKEILG